MARYLSLSLSKTTLKTIATSPTASRLVALRSLSTIPSPDPEESTTTTDPLLRKLEDAIHRIIVRRAAPDWLPFLPGTSYWVPPARSAAGSLSIAQLVEKLANPLTDEETLSTTTSRGWPSSDYFVKGALPNPADSETVAVKAEGKTSSNISKSENEEG